MKSNPELVSNNKKKGSQEEKKEVTLYGETYAQSFYGFFSKKFKQLYMYSPINLSSITGWRYPDIPHLSGNPIVGRLTTLFAKEGFLDNLIAAGKRAASHKSGMCYYWIANKCLLLVTKPEHIHQVLVMNDKNLARDSSVEVVKKFLGPNLITDQGDLWKKKRTIYSDWVHKQPPLDTYEPQLKQIINNFITRIQPCENTLDVQELFIIFTLEVVMNCLISSINPEESVKILDYYLKISNNVANFKAITKWMLPDIIRNFLFGKDEYKNFETFKIEMKKTFNGIFLDPHEETIRNADNFINSIWQLRSDKEKPLLDSPDIFGDANMLFLASTDSTTATLQFAVKLLCAHPDAEEKLRSALKEHFHDQELTIKNINKVTYLDMVIKEVMRICPPIPMFPRDVMNPFVLDELPLSKGDIVLYAPYLTHHLNDIWENPEQFIPERFAEESIKKIPHYAYIPFGAGPHNCIGQRFALQNLKMLLAAIYMRYHVEVENNNFNLTLDRGTLKPRDPVMVRFLPIEQSLSDKQKSIHESNFQF
jgi:cytochrome P450